MAIRERLAARARGDALLRAQSAATLPPAPPPDRDGDPVGAWTILALAFLATAPFAIVGGTRAARRAAHRPRRASPTPAISVAGAETAATVDAAAAGMAGEEAEDVAGGDLKRRIVGGVGWKAASAIATQVSRMAVAILLARLLSPTDFGLAAAVLVLAGLASILVDPALGIALIQRKSITEAHRSTVFWISAGLGGLFTAAMVAASGPLASFYGQPELQPMFAVFALTFLLMGIQTTQATLMTRAMDFRSLELRMIAANLIGGIVGVAAALAGLGAWALILQALAVTAVSTVLLWVFSTWRPQLVFSGQALRELGGNGARAYGTNIVWFMNTNTDTILIARFLGPASLGAYSLAFNLMLFPISRIATPIRSVLFPAFSRIQDERERLAAGWLRGNRLIAAVAMPAMLGMIVVAPDFVPVVLGQQWTSAVPVLQVLAVVGLVQALETVGGSTLNAVGRFGTVLRFTAVTYAANVAAFVCGLPWGIEGVAIAYAISTLALFPVFTVITARAVDSSLAAFARFLRGVTEAAVGMTAAVGAARWLLVEQGVPAELRLIALIAVGAAAYLGLVAWRAPELGREVRDLARRRRASAGSAARQQPVEAGG